jgi:predicted nucleic acid-binding protein
MSDKYFIDTNIFAYCFDERRPEKKVRALTLISDALATGNGIISWQVIQEFLNISTRKFEAPLKPSDAKLYLQKVLHPLCLIYPDFEIYQMAIDIQQKTAYAFYDALIIAAARRGDCRFLYSEDLRDGHQIENLRVVNPFNHSN